MKSCCQKACARLPCTPVVSPRSLGVSIAHHRPGFQPNCTLDCRDYSYLRPHLCPFRRQRPVITLIIRGRRTSTQDRQFRIAAGHAAEHQAELLSLWIEAEDFPGAGHIRNRRPSGLAADEDQMEPFFFGQRVRVQVSRGRRRFHRSSVSACRNRPRASPPKPVPNPAAWAAPQVAEAFAFDTAPRFLLRDRDAIDEPMDPE
jgi:hypothetical protein